MSAKKKTKKKPKPDWTTTPNGRRNRRMKTLTLSDEAHEALERLVKDGYDSESAAADAAICALGARRR
jgi:hypothetical protein